METARVSFNPERLTLGTEAGLGFGTEVSAFGYPLTRDVPDPTTGRRIGFNHRYLKGYVTRAIDNAVPGYPSTTTIELDMPAPRGLSGSPVMVLGTTRVIGVVYGTKDTGPIEKYSRVDDTTGERVPNLQRITTFAVGHWVDSLMNLRRAATAGLPLADYLQT